MINFIRTGVAAAAFALLINIFAAADANAQVGPLRDILNRMDQHNQKLQTLRSDVTMVKWNAQLDESDTNQGSTVYLPKSAKRPMYVRIDWTTPVQEQMSVIGDEYRLYRPRLNQLIKGKVNKAKNNGAAGGALAFMSMSKEQLKANYTVKYLGEETVKSGIKTFHIELTPKAASSYKSAELWVDADGMPVQAKVIEANNDSTTVLLTNIKKNETIKTDVFVINYPKTAKVING
jgi:outer membrane lipoprotein-sorting protein